MVSDKLINIVQGRCTVLVLARVGQGWPKNQVPLKSSVPQTRPINATVFFILLFVVPPHDIDDSEEEKEREKKLLRKQIQGYRCAIHNSPLGNPT